MDQLPVTATEIASWAIAAIAIAIVVVGGIMLLVSRRRRAAQASAEPTAVAEPGSDDARDA